MEMPDQHCPEKKENFSSDHSIFGFLVQNFSKDKKPKLEESYDYYLQEMIQLKGITKPDNFIRMSIGTNLRQSTNITTFFQQLLIQQLQPIYLAQLFENDESQNIKEKTINKAKKKKNKNKKNNKNAKIKEDIMIDIEKIKLDEHKRTHKRSSSQVVLVDD